MGDQLTQLVAQVPHIQWLKLLNTATPGLSPSLGPQLYVIPSLSVPISSQATFQQK